MPIAVSESHAQPLHAPLAVTKAMSGVAPTHLPPGKTPIPYRSLRLERNLALHTGSFWVVFGFGARRVRPHGKRPSEIRSDVRAPELQLDGTHRLGCGAGLPLMSPSRLLHIAHSSGVSGGTKRWKRSGGTGIYGRKN